MDDLNDRVALVTGASRGIGRGAAWALANAACHVAVGYRRSQAAAETLVAEIEAIGRRAIAV